ncbi:MAG: hypothetical protein QQN63_04595 [Nitrosopumilus sp.]
MSRTRKDRKQKSDDYDATNWYLFKQNVGDRIHRFCRIWWKKERAKVRDSLIKGQEPESTRTRGSVKRILS